MKDFKTKRDFKSDFKRELKKNLKKELKSKFKIKSKLGNCFHVQKDKNREYLPPQENKVVRSWPAKIRSENSLICNNTIVSKNNFLFVDIY